MDPEANWTVLGTRRTMITWVFLLYLAGFHLSHYPFERIQKGMDTFTVAQKRDTESAFSVTGRMDSWNMWYATFGKHLQAKSHIKVNGQKIENPEYVTEDDGEMIVRFGHFFREMFHQEAPILPTGDQCVAIC